MLVSPVVVRVKSWHQGDECARKGDGSIRKRDGAIGGEISRVMVVLKRAAPQQRVGAICRQLRWLIERAGSVVVAAEEFVVQ